MKKRIAIKLVLNKQRISELSNGNLVELKGGSTLGYCPTITNVYKCLGMRTKGNTCMCLSEDWVDCGTKC